MVFDTIFHDANFQGRKTKDRRVIRFAITLTD